MKQFKNLFFTLLMLLLFGIATIAILKLKTISRNNQIKLNGGISSQKEELKKEVVKEIYQNKIFDFAFVYPSDIDIEFENPPYSKYGEKLGIVVPYQIINIAKRHRIAIKVWDEKVSQEIFQSRQTDYDEVKETKIDNNEAESFYKDGELIRIKTLAPGNKYLLEILISKGDSSPSFIEDILNSIRFTNENHLSDTSCWQEFVGKFYSFKYPQDWFLNDNYLTDYNFSSEDRNKLFPGSALNLLAQTLGDKTLPQWFLEDNHRSNDYYITKQKIIRDFGNKNKLISFEFCNKMEVQVKGVVVGPGEYCEKRLFFTNNEFVIKISNSYSIDHTLEQVLSTFSFVKSAK